MTSDEPDDGVLDPEELTLEDDDERVTRLDENRVVVRPERSSGDRPHSLPSVPDLPATTRESDPADPAAESTADRPITGAVDPADVLEAVPEPHGVDISLKTDGEVARFSTTSTDVREVFADLLTWYANQLDDDCSPGEALEVMLATTDLE